VPNVKSESGFGRKGAEESFFPKKCREKMNEIQEEPLFAFHSFKGYILPDMLHPLLEGDHVWTNL
jgi:hypothetical protein